MINFNISGVLLDTVPIVGQIFSLCILIQYIIQKYIDTIFIK